MEDKNNKLFLSKVLNRLQALEKENKILKSLVNQSNQPNQFTTTTTTECPHQSKPAMIIYQKTKIDPAGNRLCDNCDQVVGHRFHVVKIGFCSEKCLEDFFALG